MRDPNNKRPMTMRHYLMLATFVVVLYCLLNNLSSVFVFLSAALSILKPVFIGLIVAFLLNLLMRPFERWLLPHAKRPQVIKLRRVLSMLIAFLILLLVLFLLIEFLFPQLSESISILVASIPTWVKNFNTWLNELALEYTWIQDAVQYLIIDSQNVNDIVSNIGNILKDYLPGVWNHTINFTSAVINFILGIVLAIYLLFNKEKYTLEIKKLLYAFLSRQNAERVLRIGQMANKSFSGFISGQITEAFILGTLCTIGMMIFNFPYPLLIGVLIGLTSVIPILGAYLGAIPSALIILMVDPIQMVWWLLFLIILQQFESNFIYPRVVGNSIGLDGFWVLFALLVGGGVAGIGGMLIGIPTFAVVYTLLLMVTDRRLQQRGLDVMRLPESAAPADEPLPVTEEEKE